MKKAFKIIGIILLVVVVLLVLLTIWTKGKIDRGEMVKVGDKWMTQEEFHKIVPPQVYHVESKNTPEEAYTAFRQALLDNDVKKALGYILEEKRAEYAEAFKDKKIFESFKTLPEVEGITKSEKDSSENMGSYYYDENNKTYYIKFIKNEKGYWEIKSI